MAAVAAEPGAAVPTTTITAATDDDGPPEPGPVGPGLLGAPLDSDGLRELVPAVEVEDGGAGAERRHVGPQLEPAAGKDPAVTDELTGTFPVDRINIDRFSPAIPGEPEGGGNVSVQAVYRSILAEPSAVFLHSFPAPPPSTEAGLSLAEPAEPTTNETTDRADTAGRDRGYTALLQPEMRPGPAEEDRLSVLDGVDSEAAYGQTSAGSEEPPGRAPKRRLLADTGKQERPAGEDRARPEPEPEPGQAAAGPGPGALGGPGLGPDLSLGSEVRVCLDHVIDDALVVSFRLGEKVFSGVLMDVSKRFGPYGIPITVFPRRDDRSRPQMTTQPVTSDDPPTKQEEVTASPASPPPPHSWTSKPPPLFQEGAPYPPPLFIRDTYNQALPQPLPRKIKRPKRRYRCEEPTSIMNAIKLRPRQVLCDKCKGVVASGGLREARRGAMDLRGEEASRRRRSAEGPISSEVKRLRNDDKGGRGAADRRSSSGIRVSSSSSSSSQRVLRGVASSSPSLPSSSSHMCLKLNSKKVLAKGSAVDRSKARQVLKKLARSSQPSPPQHRRSKDQNQDRLQAQGHDRTKAVTRAAALQNHNQKVHFTRRLQHLSGAAIGSTSHTALPPRMRLKPQRYRTDDSQLPCCSSSSSSSPPKQSARSSPPKPALSPAPSPSLTTAPPPPSTTSLLQMPPSCAASVAVETQEVCPPEEEGLEQGGTGDGRQVVEAPPPSSASSLDSSHSECSSTETFDLPPPGDPPSSSPPAPAPPPSSSLLGLRCPSSSSPTTPPPRADGEETQAGGEEEEEEGGELKRTS
ncbi:hypothetical protein L3Q82_006670 [Scortum barcoo]|uniref:Uncharacterized protein n=1 Tax=Scortum barcoo TaxID=214431 RepID=A0ACB8X016_9TELE|nr:hypothetical protein L3Q82_006670 [Scortum barcoo]